MDRKVLECYVELFNKQEGRKYRCSNQTVVCGVITNDRDRALSVMEEKGATIKLKSRVRIEWELGNERWLWRHWAENCRGYRFYKIIVDDSVSNYVFDYIVKPCCANYCCSFEII